MYLSVRKPLPKDYDLIFAYIHYHRHNLIQQSALYALPYQVHFHLYTKQGRNIALQ